MSRLKKFGIILRRFFGVAHCTYWVGYVTNSGYGRAIMLAPRKLTEKHIENITAQLQEAAQLQERECGNLTVMGLTKIKGEGRC